MLMVIRWVRLGRSKVPTGHLRRNRRVRRRCPRSCGSRSSRSFSTKFCRKLTVWQQRPNPRNSIDQQNLKNQRWKMTPNRSMIYSKKSKHDPETLPMDRSLPSRNPSSKHSPTTGNHRSRISSSHENRNWFPMF
uniref:(northern house mosquito) hypothetical protein n=1 Tax=Culex pipiens TaxID=7175 RepID=A0A8D8AGT3_CULPI